jgi:periplasmic divalent cation tolerance protein
MSDKRIVLTTVDDKKEAEDLAWALLERKLAACVNIIPVSSVFRWKGELEQQAEHLLVIKTTAAAFERVRDAIKELNTNELPECVEVPIERGLDAYLQWIADSVK